MNGAGCALDIEAPPARLGIGDEVIEEPNDGLWP
jgi:hypothetical protein